MAEPVETQVILVSNASGQSAGEIDLQLPHRWTPKIGHYLDMTIRRIDFTNFFRHNITATSNHLAIAVDYVANPSPTGSEQAEFPWTAIMSIHFPISRKTPAEIATYINSEVTALYNAIQNKTTISPAWAGEEIGTAEANAKSRIRLAIPAAYLDSISTITNLDFPRPVIAIDSTDTRFTMSLSTVTASTITLKSGKTAYPAIYVGGIGAALKGELPEKLGLVDPFQPDSNDVYLFEIDDADALRDTHYPNWEGGTHTPQTGSNPPKSVPQAFPNIISLSPKLLMIESSIFDPPRYPLMGFSADIPRRAPIVTIPIPDASLIGSVQLFAPDPISFFRIPGSLEKLSFNFYFDGKPSVEDGFEIILELVVREMPEKTSVERPSFDANVHAAVAPPILDFQGIHQSRQKTSFTHPERYDPRIKRHRAFE